MSEHRVKVENGKYEFIQRGGWKLDILRYGEAWCTDVDAAKAIGGMMAELDAARVVLAAARAWQASMSKPLHEQADADQALNEAINLHDRLVDDREPPSPWTAP